MASRESFFVSRGDLFGERLRFRAREVAHVHAGEVAAGADQCLVQVPARARNKKPGALAQCELPMNEEVNG